MPMDEQTKHIVASNLTGAFYAAQGNRADSQPVTERDVVAVFRRLLQLLDEGESSDFVEVMPEVGDAR